MAKDNSLGHPHDSFIKAMFKNPKLRRAFFETYICQDFKKPLDLNRIEALPTEFVHPDLKQHRVDMLFKTYFAQSDTPCYIYNLVEAQSTAERFLPLRLLQYKLNIMQRHLDDSRRDGLKDSEICLPLVHVCVFYTGQKPYHHSLDLYDLYQHKGWCADDALTYVQLVDLAKASLDARQNLNNMLCLFELALLKRSLKAIVDLLNEISFDRQVLLQFTVDEIDLLFHYLAKVDESSDHDIWQVLTKSLPDKHREAIMNLEQRISNRGREEGRQEGLNEGFAKGRLEGKKAVVKLMLKEGYKIDIIEKLTGIMKRDIESLRDEG